MAAKKKTASKSTATETKTRKRRKPSDDFTPKGVWDRCVEEAEGSGNNSVNATEIADEFNVTVNAIKQVVLDYMFSNGLTPAFMFASKGSSVPGLIRVRNQNKDGAPCMMIGPGYLKQLGIEEGNQGHQFTVDVDKDSGSITLSLSTDSE